MLNIIALLWSVILVVCESRLIAGPGLLSMGLLKSSASPVYQTTYAAPQPEIASLPNYETYAVAPNYKSYEPLETVYQTYTPQPYNFGYETVDNYGTKQSRKESGNGYGGVTGSYSYQDANGIYRTVEYIADKLGFRATIKTNEPGTDSETNPASVYLDARPLVVALAGPVYKPSANYNPAPIRSNVY